MGFLKIPMGFLRDSLAFMNAHKPAGHKLGGSPSRAAQRRQGPGPAGWLLSGLAGLAGLAWLYLPYWVCSTTLLWWLIASFAWLIFLFRIFWVYSSALCFEIVERTRVLHLCSIFLFVQYNSFCKISCAHTIRPIA